MATGRNKSRDTKPNKQGSRSKSTTKKVVDAVKKGIKNQPIVKGLTKVRNKARSSIKRSLDKKSNNTFTKLEAGADTKRKASEKRKKREFINKTEKAIARGRDRSDQRFMDYSPPPRSSSVPRTQPSMPSAPSAESPSRPSGVPKRKSTITSSVRPKKRPESLRPKIRPTKKSAKGGSLKAVPEGNKGLKKLPTAVRNKMGYMQKGGSCRGMGKATRGGSYGRMG